ncbi:MAG: hypothetical protein AAGF11_03840 [Myxococcota bacterium]
MLGERSSASQAPASTDLVRYDPTMGLLFRVGGSIVVGLLGSGCNLDTSGVGDGSTGSPTGSPASTVAPSTSSPNPIEDSTGSTSSVASGSATGQGSTGPEADGSGSSSGDELEPWPTGPFGRITRVDILSTDDNDDDPSLTADMLEIVFQSNRDNGDDELYWSSRDSVNEQWDIPQPIDELNDNTNNTTNENTPELSADGLVLMFSSTRRGGQDLDVFISYRKSRDDTWEVPLSVDTLNTSDEELAPTLTPDLQQVYLCSSRPGDLMRRNIWRADVMMNGAELSFSPPQIVMDISTNEHDCTMAVSPDGLVILFDIANDDNTAIWEATRDSPDGMFGNATRLDELNVDGQSDQDPWVSPDGHVIYFSSTRDDGDQDIFFAER